ncbi:hypothetical protein [Paenibacillus sp. UMB4589-SE434]|uniref:hypothetical protein n=1 Tax=Paenibacillus sp. UMB4589-SE434 TaxID=3046314 RepID=UPI0025519A3B|nr:hypothetical protein [Paenibacillus sp. UMB4589-SE434]MDK8180287.1 hypothetical protein [Paenibacillus sp. UMB4589-SE434]
MMVLQKIVCQAKALAPFGLLVLFQKSVILGRLPKGGTSSGSLRREVDPSIGPVSNSKYTKNVIHQ